MYVPSMGLISHYFHRRRTLAMTLAASGSPIGSIIHPIMLNNFIKKIGFANGVRISAAFVSLLLFVACWLMRTRLEPPKNATNQWGVAKGVFRDFPFLIMTIGYDFVLRFLGFPPYIFVMRQTCFFTMRVLLSGVFLSAGFRQAWEFHGFLFLLRESH